MENRDYKMTAGFIGGVLTLASVYAASSSPIPIFKIYAGNLALSHGFLSLTAAVYFQKFQIVVEGVPEFSPY